MHGEVIVVDGGPEDGTAELARQLGARVFVQRPEGLRIVATSDRENPDQLAARHRCEVVSNTYVLGELVLAMRKRTR